MHRIARAVLGSPRAKVDGADLRGADLTGAVLSGVDIEQVSIMRTPDAPEPTPRAGASDRRRAPCRRCRSKPPRRDRDPLEADGW